MDYQFLRSGSHIRSAGGSFVYEIIGPVCRLYDREELPWPSCSLAWKGKQPSWNRIGPRFVADMASRRSPSYAVKLIDEKHTLECVEIRICGEYCDIGRDLVIYESYCEITQVIYIKIQGDPINRESFTILTLFPEKLPSTAQRFWYRNNHWKPGTDYSKPISQRLAANKDTVLTLTLTK